MRSKVTQPKVIYQFSLEEYIPDDHLLRLVDSALDLSFVRDLVRERYSDVGAPSIDPVVIFKMMLLGYLYGISSERRLAEECRYNLAFKWFLGYDLDERTPDHSTFSKARARYGRLVFEQFFAEIVRECQDQGLTDGERIFIDATLLKANASRKSLLARAADYPRPDQTPHEYLDRFWEENDADDHDVTEPPESKPPQKPRVNDEVGSRTDPDAGLVSVRPLEVVADDAYGLRERYEFLLKRGIRPNIPYHNARSKRRSEKEEVGFVYDAEKGGYRCPAGKRLYKVSTSPSGHIVYRVHRTACHGCPNQGQLCKAKRPSIVSTRADSVLAEVDELRSTVAAKEAYARRK